MPSTTPDGLTTPGDDDVFNWVPQMATLAEDVQNALNRRGNALKGTVAERNAYPGPQEGMIWVDTNSERRVWRYSNGQWVHFTQDTGWVNIPIASGFQAYQGRTPQARIRDEVLYLRGCISPVSGNMPTTGQVDITGSIQMIEDRKPHPNTAWDVVPCLGPTGGTIMRLYISDASTLRYGASNQYGNGNASYISLSGASGCWTF